MLKVLKLKQKRLKKIIFTALILVFAVAPLTLGGFTAYAESLAELRARSRTLQQEISENRAKALAYQTEADSLETKLSRLESEIAALNGQIELTTVKIKDLQLQLEQAQAELERQKAILKESMIALYKKSGASTFELLMSSDSFSQFIDEQEYLDRLKAAIQESAEKVIALKQQIQDQKKEQEELLKQQQSQRDLLAAKRQEQAIILNRTRDQQESYERVVEDLRARQAEINSQIFAASGNNIDFTAQTSYPWANIEPWSFNSCYVDPWGMCKRQCVSYTAWAVAHSGRQMPYWGGRGNANEWDDNARAEGIPVDYDPKAGDVAISNAGFYGHAMYVEAVLPDGRLRISQFNVRLQGEYSEATINRGSLVFIHFP